MFVVSHYYVCGLITSEMTRAKRGSKIKPLHRSEEFLMPKARRNTTVPLTQTTKKGRPSKTALISTLHSTLPTSSFLHLFQILNPRSTFLQQVRQELKPETKLMVGKNRVMEYALKTHEHDNPEVKKGVLWIAEALKGQVGLMLSGVPAEQLQSQLQSLGERDYARAGFKATQEIVIPAGPLHQYYDPESLLSTTLEQQLRDSGMNAVLTRDKQGRLSIEKPFTICKEGTQLTADQARLLKLFGVMMAEFEIRLLRSCNLETGETIEHSENSMEDE